MTLEHGKTYRIVNKHMARNCFHIKGLSHHFKIRPSQGRKPLVTEKCSLSSFYPGDREMGSIDWELLWGLWGHVYIFINKQTFFITVQGMPELNSMQRKKKISTVSECMHGGCLGLGWRKGAGGIFRDDNGNADVHTNIRKTDSQWEFAVWLRELKLGLCDNLEKRWDGVGDAKEAHEGGDICIPVADQCWCMAETDTIL